jgi:hypothetical protein
VDNKHGPAVFFRLGELDPGALVRIDLEGRSELLFRVYAVREYPKAAFPTSLVYAATPGPELWLVTCGRSFDTHTGHYLDNVVVFARYVVWGRPGHRAGPGGKTGESDYGRWAMSSEKGRASRSGRRREC